MKCIKIEGFDFLLINCTVCEIYFAEKGLANQTAGYKYIHYSTLSLFLLIHAKQYSQNVVLPQLFINQSSHVIDQNNDQLRIMLVEDKELKLEPFIHQVEPTFSFISFVHKNYFMCITDLFPHSVPFSTAILTS